MSRNVSVEQRLLDRDLIEVGKRKNGYQRHAGGPYAFSYRGRLYAEYDRLLDLLDAEGRQAWSHKEKSRLKS